MLLCASLNISTGLDNVRQKIELYPTKAASQRTQLSGVELDFILFVTDALKLRNIQ